MMGDPVAGGNGESAEKAGMRNAWGNIAVTYDEMFAARMTHLTGRGLDVLAPAPHWDGLDIACGPGLTTSALAERLLVRPEPRPSEPGGVQDAEV